MINLNCSLTYIIEILMYINIFICQLIRDKHKFELM